MKGIDEGLFNPDTTLLDLFANVHCIVRDIYSSDKDDKPNDHCVWKDISVTSTPIFAWVENDEHYRNRIKEAVTDYSRKCKL